MNTQALDNQFPHRISLSQAAELSGYHQDYLGQLCRLGKIKAAKIGRNWYTTKSELQSLINFTDNIEEESGDLSMQVDAEDDKGLFDFSRTDQEAEPEDVTPSLDGIQPAGTASVAVEVDEPASETAVRRVAVIAPTPVVSDNYLISQVDGIPIRLQADNPNRQHHTIQTLVTRMKLDSLRSEVLQLTDVMQSMSDDLAMVKELVAKHDQVLQTRKDLATTYAATIDIMPERAIREQALLSLEDDSSSEPVVTWQAWLAPVTAAFIVVGLTTWLIASNFPAISEQVSTIKYPAIMANNPGQVAGDKDDSLITPEGANINIEP